MITLKSLEPFYIFDMANNHSGSLQHGLDIINKIYQVSSRFPYHFGFKLQYRHLKTFINPKYKDRMDFKYVKRFTETRLQENELKALKDEMVRLGFITSCTPYDEASVDLAEEHGFNIIKVASCSFTDWSLLERIAKTDKPIILSTADASLNDMDKVVSFMEHRNKDFALMHCVAEYPTENDHLQLNQIDLLRNRYPKIPIGYSTHEAPSNYEGVKLAIAKGATIFEKHVGIGDNLNAYSASPFNILQWLISAQDAYVVCGSKERIICDKKELNSLKRGVYVNRDIKQGEKIEVKDMTFAIPTFEGQLVANDISKYTEIITKYDIKKDEPLLGKLVIKIDTREKVYGYVKQVRDLVAKSGIQIPYKVDVEVSHHYGIDNFDKVGCTIFTLVNREYCKKLIILLAGQQHPEQYHQQKEETFNILFGDLDIKLDDEKLKCKVGELITVNRGVKHSFGTKGGCIIEEISSTHYKEDSYYTDPKITANKSRKTQLTYWMG